MPLSTDLIKGIVRILKSDGSTSGAGFIISEDGLIATCSHVVQDLRLQERKEPRPEKVNVVLVATGEKVTAAIEPDGWLGIDKDDVAILKVEGGLPYGVQPLPLGSSGGTGGHSFQTYGFPEARSVEGLWGYGTIGDPVPEAGRSLLQLTGTTEITPGFSGAPVLDKLTRRVVGMVTSITAPDRYGRLAETAFITPSEVLRPLSTHFSISDICPYLSLNAFTETDSEFFFGRQMIVERLLEGLRHAPKFMAVLGPSGSGKSSVVKAGLIPKLRRGAVPGSDNWGIVVIRPADNPFNQLSLQGLAGGNLSQAALGWLSSHSDKRRLVLILDQFEEIMTTTPERLSQSFVAQLVRTLTSDLPVTVIVILRDDFYSRLAKQAPSLMEWIEQGLINIPLTLEKEELISIVEEPPRSVGLEFETGLVDVIVKDILETAPIYGESGRVGRSTVLPLLEFALTELWKRRHDGVLSVSAYRDLGGVTGGLAQWADDAFYSLDENLHPIARRILTGLVHLGNESQGLPDSRQRMSFADLCLAASCKDDGEREAINRVIRLLTDKRLLVTSIGTQGRQETVEIIHDALIREWGLMQQWLREDRIFLSWRQKLDERINSWMETSPEDAAQRDNDRLLRGRDIAESEGWLNERNAELSQREKEYVSSSLAFRDKEQETRSLQRRRKFLVVAMVAILTTGLAAYAVYQEQVATKQSQIAFAGQLLAQAELIGTQKVEDLVFLAYESTALRYSQDAEDLLWRGLALLPHPTSQMVHEDNVRRVAFSPDGKLVATASEDYTARIWNATNGRELQRLIHHGPVNAISFSKNGRYLATASGDTTSGVWDVFNGSEILEIRHNASVKDVAFSPDGRYVATASQDGTSRVMEALSGRPVLNLSYNDSIDAVRFSPDSLHLAVASNTSVFFVDLLSGQEVSHMNHADAVNAVSFSPDGKRIATASSDWEAGIWNATNGVQLAYMDHEGPIWDINFSPDGNYVVTASEDRTARVWNASNGKEIAREAHDLKVNAAVFSPDGKYVASAGSDNTAKVWEVLTGREVNRMIHEDEVWGIAFSPDGRYIATASLDNTARVWKLTNSFQQTAGLVHDGEVTDVAFSPDGKYIATASDDYTARVWEVAKGNMTWRFVHTFPVDSVKFSPDGKSLATASEDYTAVVWDISNGTKIAEVRHSGYIPDVAFSPNGKYIATASYDRTAKVWRVADSAEVSSMSFGDFVTRIAYSPDGNYAAASSIDHTVRIWNALSGHSIATLASDDIVNDVAFSPDGRYIASGSNDGTARVWLVASKQQVAVLQNNGKVYAVEFSPDGERLATASSDNNARIWDFVNKTEATPRMLTGGGVFSINFTKDGRYLATGSLVDGTARVWDVTSGKEVALFTHNGDVYAVSFSPDGRYLASASQDKTARIWNWQEDPTRDVCSYLTSNIGPDKWRQYAGADRPYEKICPNLP